MASERGNQHNKNDSSLMTCDGCMGNGGGGGSAAGKSSNNDSNKNDKNNEEQQSQPQQQKPLVDITDLITACAASLTMKEPFLCRPESFQLHDAMAATQLMDAKMDSCQVPSALAAPLLADYYNSNSCATKKTVLFPRPCPESLGNDPFCPLPWNELTMQQTCTIVLHQLVRLQALVSGSSVGESVFTCFYAHANMLHEMEQQVIVLSLLQQPMEVAETEKEDEEADRCHGNNDQDVVNVVVVVDDNHNVIEKMRAKAASDLLYCAQLTLFVATCAIVEISDLFRSIVINADIYEEEDFVTQTHDMPFYSIPTTTATATTMGLQQQERRGKGEKHHKHDTLKRYLDTVVDVLENHNKDIQDIGKLRLSLTYLNGLLLFCSTMGKLRQKDLQGTVKTMKTLAMTLCQGLDSLRECVLASTAKSSDDNNESALSENRTVAQVFDSYTNRPLFGNTPVRKVSFFTLPESLAVLHTVTYELEWAVCGLLIHGTSLARIDRMLRRMSGCNILSRSLIVLNLYFDDLLLGQHDLQPFIVDHIKQWQHVPQALLVTEHAQAFLNRLAKPIYDSLKVQISNRNRQRAYLEASLFQEWNSLQAEANLVDTHFRREQQQQPLPMHDGGSGISESPPTPPIFGYYVLMYLLRLMDQHLTCGIEGGLFHAHDEVCSAFWYRDFILAALLQNLTQMRRGKEQHYLATVAKQQQQQQATKPETLSHPKKGGKKKKASQGAAGKGIPPPPPPPPLPHQRSLEEIQDALEVRVTEGKRLLCRGIVRFIVALRQAGALGMDDDYDDKSEEPFEFTSQRTRFERRFTVFAHQIRHPPPLGFDDYLEGSNGSGVSTQDLVQSSIDIFKQCRTLVDSILQDIHGMGTDQAPFAPVQEQEARSLLKVCVGNTVYLMKFNQLLQAATTTGKNSTPNSHHNKINNSKVEFDFDAHKEFCILKLT